MQIFFGDLNFRVNAKYAEGKAAATRFNQDDMAFLQNKDQLNKLRLSKKGPLSSFSE